MIRSCFKEKDAVSPPGSVEKANAVECSEHLEFYHIVPFHKQEFQTFPTCCVRIRTERGKKIEERALQNKAGFYHLYTFNMETGSHF